MWDCHYCVRVVAVCNSHLFHAGLDVGVQTDTAVYQLVGVLGACSASGYTHKGMHVFLRQPCLQHQPSVCVSTLQTRSAPTHRQPTIHSTVSTTRYQHRLKPPSSTVSTSAHTCICMSAQATTSNSTPLLRVTKPPWDTNQCSTFTLAASLCHC